MRISAPLVLAGAYVMAIASAFAMTLSEPNCKPNNCTIKVSVGGNSCGGGISVSPDPVTVRANGKALVMKWEVTTPGWVFDTDGIYLNVPGGGDFGKAAGQGTTTYTIENLAKVARTVKYDVNLRREKGEEKCRVDPTIMNY